MAVCSQLQNYVCPPWVLNSPLESWPENCFSSMSSAVGREGDASRTSGSQDGTSARGEGLRTRVAVTGTQVHGFGAQSSTAQNEAA